MTCSQMPPAHPCSGGAPSGALGRSASTSPCSSWLAFGGPVQSGHTPCWGMQQTLGSGSEHCRPLQSAFVRLGYTQCITSGAASCGPSEIWGWADAGELPCSSSEPWPCDAARAPCHANCACTVVAYLLNLFFILLMKSIVPSMPSTAPPVPGLGPRRTAMSVACREDCSPQCEHSPDDPCRQCQIGITVAKQCASHVGWHGCVWVGSHHRVRAAGAPPRGRLAPQGCSSSESEPGSPYLQTPIRLFLALSSAALISSKAADGAVLPCRTRMGL